MVESLEDRVEEFVASLFEGYQPSVPRAGKVINDSLVGNQYFTQHEIAIIDTPVLQRLRRIKQTGLVYQVFPSATHSRFEHSLGASTLAERCFNAIRDRFHIESPGEVFEPTGDRLSGDVAHLRVAALLHDVGHGLCSHAAEQIYGDLTDLREFRNNPEYAKNAPGEILSYLIITSPTFTEWFSDIVVDRCKAKIDLDVVAQMVLGSHPNRNLYFLAQLVSSPFDADKLDYIARDSYYCGLALTVDLPRFYSMISTTMYEDYRILVLRSYVPLEQVLFSKMNLFSSVYQQQKVKCVDSMLRSLIQHIANNPDQSTFEVRGKKINFAEAVQYLYPTDDEFFVMGSKDDFVRKMLARFSQRDLFVRCVELSRRTISNWDDYHRKRLVDLSSNSEALHDVEQKIHQRLPEEIRAQCNVGEVLLSVPSVPQIKSDFAFIQPSPDVDPEPIENFFPLEQWTDSYAQNKWKSFVYAPREFADHVKDAALEIVVDDLGIKVDAGKSRDACYR